MADLRVKEIASMTKLDGAAVLDIGFGRPYFLNLVRMLGAAPYGLELDPQAIEYARHAGFQDVFLGQIETFRSPRLYDVVALLDVVEHPLDPMSLLRHSVAVLRDGGLLAIWTPNGGHHEIANDPVTFRVDLEHLQYFTTSSLAFVARKLGLEIVHIETLGHPGLQGLCSPRNTVGHEGRLKSLARKTARRLPGFNRVNRLRQQRIAANRDERSGTYHLFCILRKQEPMRPHMVDQPAPN